MIISAEKESTLRKAYFLFAMVFLVLIYNVYGQQAALVNFENDRLVYEHFPVFGQTDSLHVIPDFSHAGYMGGGVVIPDDIPVRVTIQPKSGDDTRRIQAAIDEISAMSPDSQGFRGVILLEKGYYSINASLTINTSGVVVRGEGQGRHGTVIFTNLREQHTAIQILGSGGLSVDESKTQTIASPYVPIGASSFTVQDASSFMIGDTIVVTRTPNNQWIIALGMDEETLCGEDPNCRGWTPESYTIHHERIIEDISGDTIFINIPMVDVIENQYGGGQISKASGHGRVEKIGIENLRLESYYFTSEDEEHGWSAVDISNSQNCWVKSVTAEHFAYATVSVSDANFNTIEDCAFINPSSSESGGRRYAFVVQGGLGNLFQRCYVSEGRHDFATGSRVSGPNVFLDGLGEQGLNDIGPHHRWATGLLFDNISGYQIRVQNRGSSGTGHGWAGAQTLFWNVSSDRSEIKVESPTGGINWGIGCVGPTQLGDGYWDIWGTHVLPRSLYLQQLKDRLGEKAVTNIAKPEQLTGEIRQSLKKWQGVGSLTHGGIIGKAPSVEFKRPNRAMNIEFWEDNDFEVTASDEDGYITQVTLLINGQPVRTLTNAPYLFDNVRSLLENLSEAQNICRVIATDNDGNTAVDRLLVYGKSEKTLDLNEYESISLCSASSTSHQEGRDAKYVIDQIETENSRWSSEEDGAVLVVEACEARHIDAVGINWYRGDERQAIFNLDVSLDSINWNNIFSGYSSGTQTSQEVYKVNDSIQYLRYTGYGNSDNRWSSIIELGFYQRKPLLSDSTTTLSAEAKSPIFIYPNPSFGLVNIVNPYEGTALLTVRDMTGKIHLTRNILPGKWELQKEALTAGIYMISVEYLQSSMNSRLIVLRK